MDSQFPIQSLEVAATFKAISAPVRGKLLEIRDLIFTLAAENENIGMIEECLKWGQISYLTKSPKSGTTIRLGHKPDTRQFAIYVPCTTSLIQDTRDKSPLSFEFEKNRALLFNETADLPVILITDFLQSALTYHHRKKK